MKISEDTMFDGKIICRQYISGYRYSIDALLLAHFAEIKNKDRILDIGTGCGIIMLVLHFLYGENIECCGVEIQQEMATLAAENLALNESRWQVVTGDIRFKKNEMAQSFEKVLCNPPFYCTGEGRVSKSLQARYARHQEHGDLNDFLQAAYSVLISGGVAFFVYPAEKCCEFIASARRAKMEVKKLRFVHGYPGIDARLALFSCVKNGRPSTVVLPPLYIYQEKNGEYSDDIAKYYQPQQ